VTAAENSAGPQQLRRLLDAVLSVGSELELPVVLRRIVEAATDLVDATYGALGVLHPDGAGLAEFITVGLSDAQVRAIGDPPKGHGLLGLLIVDPKPIRAADIARHPDRYGFPPHHPPMRSFLGVPIKLSDRVFGNLYLADKRGAAEFTAVDEELVVALASAAAMSVENARLHAQVADMALVEDRERIARDLHDTVMQRLYAAGLTLQSALRRADPDVGGRIEQAIDDIDAVIRDIRTTIFELHTTRTTGRSLRREVVTVAAESARALGFEPTVRFDGPVDTLVPDEVADQAVVVLREALGNVARHAHAHGVGVTVAVATEPLVLRLEIDDDGIGMEAADRHGGHGLRNIASRALRLGGRVDVDSSPGAGTIIRWEVPIPAPR
jgi:signal transduction histidine kinase